MKINKLFIYIIISIIIMILIFSFSNKNSKESNGTSKNIINYSITIYEKIFDKKVNHEIIIKKLNYSVRKLAHYTLYFLLGISIYNLILYTKFDNKIIISIIICMLYAFTDEFHQLFIIGRTGQFKDIIIDTIGSTTSILILNKIHRRNK